MDSTQRPLRKLDQRAPAAIGRQARLDLVCELRRGRTVVTEAYAEPPLRIGRSLEVDGALYLILVCSAPGVFAGDALHQRVRVGEGARVLLASQSALQVHPGDSDLPAVVHHEYVVAGGGELHCQWDPVIPFAGARLVQQFDIQVESSSRFYWSDALMSGRARRDEHWQFDSLSHELRLEVDHALRYLERYHVEPQSSAQSPAAPWRAGQARYFGTALVHHDAATAEHADRLHRSVAASADLSAAVDLVEPRLIVGRFLAESGASFARGRARFRTEALEHVFQAPQLVFRR